MAGVAVWAAPKHRKQLPGPKLSPPVGKQIDPAFHLQPSKLKPLTLPEKTRRGSKMPDASAGSCLPGIRNSGVSARSCWSKGYGPKPTARRSWAFNVDYWNAASACRAEQGRRLKTTACHELHRVLPVGNDELFS